MPDENRFSGLGDMLEEDDGDDVDGGQADVVEPEAAKNETASVADDGSRQDTVDSDDPTAFPFDATTAKSVYVRPESLEEVEDAEALVNARLRTEYDVRNLAGREFYDAVFRAAADDIDGIIEKILEAREQPTEDESV
jgi:hypothetical protein